MNNSVIKSGTFVIAIVSAAIGAPSNINAKYIPQQIVRPDPYTIKKYAHLKAIEMQESSGGKNLAHKKIRCSKSIHNGHSAYGRYGLMPNTVKFIIKTDSQLFSKYGYSLNLNNEQFHKFMKENHLEQIMASRYYDLLAEKFGQNLGKIYHAWYHGPARTARELKNGVNVANHPLVRKVLKFNEKNNNYNNLPKK